MIDFSDIQQKLDEIRAMLADHRGYLYMGNLYVGGELPKSSDLPVRLDPIYSDWLFDGPVDFQFPKGGGPAFLVPPFKPIR